MNIGKFSVAALLAAIVGLWCNPSSAAEEYPSAAMTIVVPFPAGGTADLLPRIVASTLR